MRILTCLTASLLGAALMFARPFPASAEADPIWQACVGAATAPNEKVTACSAVIDARKETGKRLAAAYCFRSHGLTEKREFDSALSDIDESIPTRPAPSPTAAASTRSSASSIARLPTTTKRSGSIRRSRWPTTTAAMPSSTRETSTARSPISTPPSNTIRRSRPPMAIAAISIIAGVTWSVRLPTTACRSS